MDSVGERNKELGIYFTPDQMALACIQATRQYINKEMPIVFDAFAGKGAFGRAVREVWPDAHLVGNDIYFDKYTSQSTYDHWIKGDYFEDLVDVGGYDLMVANPPFELTEKLAYSVLEQRGGNYFGLFARLTLLEGKGRREKLWDKYPPAHIFIIDGRIQMTNGDSTKHFADNVGRMFVLWSIRPRLHPTHISWISCSDYSVERYEE